MKSRPTLSLISAKPRILNPGMLSVELAFERMLARSGLDFDVVRYCLEDQPELTLPVGKVGFRSLRRHFEEALAAERILFWGDFLHAWNYHVYDVLPEIRRDPAFATEIQNLPDRDVVAWLRRFFLLTKAPDEVLRRTLSFGTTLLGDHALVGAIDAGYEDDLRRFASGCAGIWMRDIVSALRIGHFCADYGRSHLGVDCALLLRREDWAVVTADAKLQPSGPYAAVHFGRTTMHHGATVDFARRLCGRLNLSPVWLSWLHANPTYFKQFRSTFPELDGSMPQDPPYPDLIGAMLGAKLVVTDTYHLSILAWRAGIPVICIGAGAELAVRTLSDKKKEIFHLMYGASPYYFFAESLVDAGQRERKLQVALDALGAKDVVARVSATMAAHASAAEADLVHALGAAG